MMFGRREPPPPLIIRDTRTEYVTREVNVHRAPTDESVRLLKEMEEAARDKIVEAVRVGNTMIDCVVHVSLDAASDDVRMRAIFSLNGAKKQVDHVASQPVYERDRLVPWLELSEKVARVIADEMIGDAFKKTQRPQMI